MARRRKSGLNINGVVLIDKPTGMTSNRVVQTVRRLFQANRAGHTGALDPLATGLLPICLGEATKFSQLLLEADKRYVVTAKLGERTDTSDADGTIVERSKVQVTEAQVHEALEHFRGEVMQVPSMFSALKYQGKPLYEYARAGIEVPREARPIQIYENKLLSFGGDRLELEVFCSKGTYIRTIVDDLGQMLGCGAHVLALRRTEIGHLGTVDEAVTLSQLEAELENDTAEIKSQYLLPIDAAAQFLPMHTLTDESLKRFLHGQPFIESKLAPLLRIYDSKDNFWGLAEQRSDGAYWPRRLVVRTE